MPDRPEEQALRVLLQRYPQLKAPHLSRRALLAASSLLAANLEACGGGGGDSTATNNTTNTPSTPAPTIAALSPSNGDLAGGTLVTLTGTNLTGATAVMFGTTAASSFTVVSSTQITATTPAHAMGTVTVGVTTPGGTATATTSFAYANGGVVTTLAGSGNPAFADGTGASASFYYPMHLAVDNSGNVYVADQSSHRIRKIVISTGEVTTLAGSGTGSFANGTGTAASFWAPAGVAVDNSGNVYVADSDNNSIRKIVASTGVVTTLAGGQGPYNSGSFNGTGVTARFNYPMGVAVDSSGNVYVADSSNHLIRKIVVSTGAVTTLAGGGAGSGTGPATDGTGTAASFNYPTGVAVDSGGNVYVADYSNNLIRKIVVSTGAVTTLAGSGFSGPIGVAVDNSGNLYVTDQLNNLIRKIVVSTGAVTTLAGGGAGSGTGPATDGTGTTASFYHPVGVAVDSSGNVYVADNGNCMIRKIS